VHDVYDCGSVLLRQGDEIPRARGNLGGFLPHWQCIVQHSILDPCKNGWTDRDAVWHDEWTWPEEQCIMWGWWSPKGRAVLGKMCLTSLTPPWIANWTDPYIGMNTTGADAWLQALDKSIIDHKGRIAHGGQNLISTIALFPMLSDYL